MPGAGGGATAPAPQEPAREEPATLEEPSSEEAASGGAGCEEPASGKLASEVPAAITTAGVALPVPPALDDHGRADSPERAEGKQLTAGGDLLSRAAPPTPEISMSCFAGSFRQVKASRAGGGRSDAAGQRNAGCYFEDLGGQVRWVEWAADSGDSQQLAKEVQWCLAAGPHPCIAPMVAIISKDAPEVLGLVHPSTRTI